MSIQITDSKYRNINCPLCNRLMLKANINSNATLEARCVRCKNIFEVEIKDGIVKIRNDIIEKVDNL